MSAPKHKAIQESFSEYDKFIKNKNWINIKKDFQISILTDALEKLKSAIGSCY